MQCTLGRILRYPVKSLSHQDSRQVRLVRGCALPGDRRFALALGRSTAPPDDCWQPAERLVNQNRFPKLAQLSTEFDEDACVLTIRRRGLVVASANLATAAGRMVLGDFFAAFLGEPVVGVPRLVDLGAGSFTDRRRPLLSVVGAGSLDELERLAGRRLAAEDLRMNLVLAGLPARAELDWEGCVLRVGEASLMVTEPIERRCAVADPATGEGATLDTALRTAFGHRHLGIYAEVMEGGMVRIGDEVRLEDTASPPPAKPGEEPRIKR